MKYRIQKPNGSFIEVTSLEGLISVSEILGEDIIVVSPWPSEGWKEKPYLVRYETC